MCVSLYNKALKLDEFGTLADSFVSNAVTKSLLKLGNCKDARKLMNLRKELFPQFAKGKNFIDLDQEYNQTCRFLKTAQNCLPKMLSCNEWPGMSGL